MQPRALARKGYPVESEIASEQATPSFPGRGVPAIVAPWSGTASYSSAKQSSVADCDNAFVDRVVGSDMGGRQLGGCGLAAINWMGDAPAPQR